MQQRVRSVVAACDLELDVSREIGILGIGARAREQRQLKTRDWLRCRGGTEQQEKSMNGQTVNKKKPDRKSPATDERGLCRAMQPTVQKRRDDGW